MNWQLTYKFKSNSKYRDESIIFKTREAAINFAEAVVATAIIFYHNNCHEYVSGFKIIVVLDQTEYNQLMQKEQQLHRLQRVIKEQKDVDEEVYDQMERMGV